MKNKIIFKTLMLKGEAGSTIVSMEKTGHVGTADIYTITFNDGSTTEISLENMSAITSVEKTSSTDTEDIYTITCADGSTQTFSVLNHNADIAALNPWYKLHDINLFGKVAEINLPVEKSYSEAITYDTKRNLFYIGTYDYSGGNYLSEIIAIDADSFNIINTYYYEFGKIGSLSYNPVNDKIYVALTGNNYYLYAVNATTMESEGVLTDQVFSVGVQYDIATGENVALQLSGSTAEFRIYNAAFAETNRYIVPIKSTDAPQQDWCVNNGIAYICTWNSILEIDYKNGAVNRLGLAGFKTGSEEPEGVCMIGDDIYSVSFRTGTDGKCAIYKYGFSSAVNIVTNRFSNVYAFNISQIIGDYPSLFEFIQGMSPNDTAFLYHYGSSDSFSDLPTLYDGDAFIAEIFVNRSTGALEYTQIELCMHRIDETRTHMERWRGIIKKSTSTAITWIPYGMNPYGKGVTLFAGVDLNNITTPGAYAVESSSVAANISNMPVAAAGRLEVKDSFQDGTGLYIIQTYYRTNSTDAEIYHRVKTTAATGFGTWKKVAYAT